MLAVGLCLLGMGLSLSVPNWALLYMVVNLALVMPLTPFEKAVDPAALVPVVDQIFWAGYAGVTWLPATAAPIGLTKDGLPVGVQIIGRQYGDYECIQFAKLLEKEYRSFEPPPAYS